MDSIGSAQSAAVNPNYVDQSSTAGNALSPEFDGNASDRVAQGSTRMDQLASQAASAPESSKTALEGFSQQPTVMEILSKAIVDSELDPNSFNLQDAFSTALTNMESQMHLEPLAQALADSKVPGANQNTSPSSKV